MKIKLGLYLLLLLSFNAMSMTYRLYSPQSGAEDKPLLVLLHGCSQSGKNFIKSTKIIDAIESHQFNVLTFTKTITRRNSLLRINNPLKCWAWYQKKNQKRNFRTGELAKIIEITKRFIKKEKTDASQTYVAGFSAGAVMTSTMATCYPDIFRGALISAGIPNKGLFSALNTNFDLNKQKLSPYGRIEEIISQLDSFHFNKSKSLQKQLDSCRKSIKQKVLLDKILIMQGSKDRITKRNNAHKLFMQFAMSLEPDANFSFNNTNEYFKYAAHSETTKIHMYEIKNLGHAWSGGDSRYIFNNSATLDSTQVMLDFFKLNKE